MQKTDGDFTSLAEDCSFSKSLSMLRNCKTEDLHLSASKVRCLLGDRIVTCKVDAVLNIIEYLSMRPSLQTMLSADFFKNCWTDSQFFCSKIYGKMEVLC